VPGRRDRWVSTLGGDRALILAVLECGNAAECPLDLSIDIVARIDVKLEAVFANRAPRTTSESFLPSTLTRVAPRSELAATFEPVADGHWGAGKFLDAFDTHRPPRIDPGIDRATS